MVSTILPPALARLAQQGAAPELVTTTLERLLQAQPAAGDRLVDAGAVTPLARAVVAVCGASNALGRLLVGDDVALDILDHLDRPVTIEADARDVGDAAESLARRKGHELLRIAARDLLGIDALEQTGAALAALASAVLAAAVSVATGRPADEAGSNLLVVGMGKLGGAELNYASDIDVVFVGAGDVTDRHARIILEIGRRCFRVDAALRPEGRSGPLVRTLQGYQAYWERWAQPWERQAMLKSRPVAGDPELAESFAAAADAMVWGRPFGADELAQVRAMKRRTETLVRRRGHDHRDVKRGPGGIRDIEFSVQLLQLVHGWLDPTIRSRTTLVALSQLADAGYVDGADAAVLAAGYRFLRTVEHRVQLVEEEQVHVVPTTPGPARRLARVLGFADGPAAPAEDMLAAELRRWQADVRSVHERLYFRPLLEAFAALAPSGPTPGSGTTLGAGTTPGPSTQRGEGTSAASARGTRTGAGSATASGARAHPGPPDTTTRRRTATEVAGTSGREPATEVTAPIGGETAIDVMSPLAVATRLGAFGFADADRTRADVVALGQGLTRSSRLMAQMLPLVLDWLSESPDPDLGLRQLRDLVVRHHQRSLVVSVFRESPEAARRLCLLLGSSRLMGEGLVRDPDVLAGLGDDDALVPASRDAGVLSLAARLRTHPEPGAPRTQLARFRRDQRLRIAARDLVGLDELPATAAALTAVDEAVLHVAMDACGEGVPWCAVGLGRLGGGELSYASDLDLVLVCADGAGQAATASAEALLGLLHGSGPFEEVLRVDLRLRPEGEQGRLVRDLAGYRAYFDRWVQTWERQAMVRARVVAGDAEVGRQFMALVDEVVWDRPITTADVTAIRRMKARIERERIPASEDPRFHLKLGPGSLSDVEWTVQLLQLRHHIPEPATMTALDALCRQGVVGTEDADRLRAAYRFCEHTRNRWHLVGSLPGGTSPGDALPARADQLTHLARSLGTTPARLRDHYQRVTRRARAVVERLFYEMPASRS